MSVKLIKKERVAKTRLCQLRVSTIIDITQNSGKPVNFSSIAGWWAESNNLYTIRGAVLNQRAVRTLQIEPSRVVLQLERVGLTTFGSETCFLKLDIAVQLFAPCTDAHHVSAYVLYYSFLLLC